MMLQESDRFLRDRLRGNGGQIGWALGLKRLKCDPLFDLMAQNVGIANLENLHVFNC
jgi:hypothetical protein